MIRVCVVAPAYMTGGQAIEAKTLVDGFRDDPDVRVELQPIDPRLPEWLARIRGVRTIARMPLYLVGLVRRVARADVVHVFTAAFWPFRLTTTPAVLVARALGKPVILNYRDGRAADDIGRRWVRWVLDRVTLLVFPSGFLRDLFGRFDYEGVVVPNVVDTERFRFRDRDPLRPVLLSCRLLEELYDIDNTIAAYRIVKQHHQSARLIIIGDGDQRARLQQLVRAENIESVEFHGAVPHANVPMWFDSADILVNSSRIDNMPHSLIEAFAAGVPVVTTPSGGIPYVVENERNGLHAEIGNPRAMAAAILRLLEDGGLARRLIEQARHDSDESYAWPAARRQWQAHYTRLARRESKSSSPATTTREPATLRTTPHE